MNFNLSFSFGDFHGHFSVFNVLLGLGFLELLRQIGNSLLRFDFLFILRLDEVEVAAGFGNNEIVNVLNFVLNDFQLVLCRDLNCP